jgi:hypothetical protein
MEIEKACDLVSQQLTVPSMRALAFATVTTADLYKMQLK